jgi:hypothetical protein
MWLDAYMYIFSLSVHQSRRSKGVVAREGKTTQDDRPKTTSSTSRYFLPPFCQKNGGHYCSHLISTYIIYLYSISLRCHGS